MEMMNKDRCLIMFAKYPEKGKVKSRLCQHWDEGLVVLLYRSFIEDLLYRLSGGDYRFRVAYHPVEKKTDFIKQFGDGFSYMPQIGEDLGERMKDAFTRCFSESFRYVVVIGSDSPDLPRRIIGEAFQALEKHGAVIGPALDGGYYLIGFSGKLSFHGVFEGIPWGTDNVFEKTMQHLQEAGIPVHVLPPWRDIDRPEDIAALIKDNEKTDFAESKTMTWLLMRPLFSIIVPVLNEESVINPAIEHIGTLQEATGSYEIIVVDGDPEGKTIGAIRDTKVITAVGKKGRGNQMNRGAALARGDILLFLHADTRLPFNALTLIDSALRDPAFVAGAFDLAIASVRPVFRLIEKTASLRSRVTRIPYGDQALFFHRDSFNAIGGFADIPIMEDVEIMRRIKKRGDPIAFIDAPVTTSSRRWEKEGVLYCTLRNRLIISLYLSGVSPERLAKFYR
ncbi:MAG: TIGR04283 family arsenosugar biosynthesis glycosyltransferase [Deltaproteobacteria bacterium]